MKMKKEKEDILTTPNGLPPANSYDDGNIPREDLPQDRNRNGQACKDKADGENA